MSEIFDLPNKHYYWGNIKTQMVAFIDLFNEFRVARYKKDGTIKKLVEVPIIVGPMERTSFINAKGKKVQRTVRVPLIHIALSSMTLDKERAFPMKSEKYMRIWAGKPKEEYYNYRSLLPYPYNFTYNMTLIGKYQEDLMQLIEQIVPLFNYHRVVKYRHPKYRDIVMSNWISITDFPNFDFNMDYSAEDRRGLLAVPITFNVEGWLVREIYDYTNFNVINEIITNYVVANQRVLKHQIIGDPKIQIMSFDRVKNGEFKEGDVLTGQTNNYNATVLALGVKYNRTDYDIKKINEPGEIYLDVNPEWVKGSTFVLTGSINGINNGNYTVDSIEEREEGGDIFQVVILENGDLEADALNTGVITSATDYYGENVEYDDSVGDQDKELSWDIETTISPDTVVFKELPEGWKVGDKFIISANKYNNNGTYTIRNIIESTKNIIVEENTIDTNIKPDGNGYGTDSYSYYGKYTTNYIIIKFEDENQTYLNGEEIFIGTDYKTDCNLCKFWDGKLEEIWTDHPEDEPPIWPNEGTSINKFT